MSTRSPGTRVGPYLFSLVLAVSVPLLFLTGFMLVESLRAQRHQQEMLVVDQVRDASQLVDQTFVRWQTGLAILAGSPLLARGDVEAFRHELGVLAGQLGDSRVYLTAPNGDILLRTGNEGAASAGVERVVRQAADLGMHAHGATITNLMVDEPAGPAVAVVVPALRAGETAPAALLVGTLDIAYLVTLVAFQPAAKQGLVVTLHDRDGVIVAHSTPSNRSVGEPTPPGLRTAAAGSAFGLLADGETRNGRPAIRAFSVGPVSGYIAVATMPENAFEATTRRNLIATVLLGTVLSAVGIAAAAQRTRRLVRALQTLGEGKLPVETGFREVDELAAQLNTAAHKREAAEATLRDSEGRLRDLVGTLDLAAIMVRDLDGTIRFWSFGCEQMYGWTADQAVERSAHVLLRTQFPVPLPQIERDLLEKGEWIGDLVQRRHDGTIIIAAARKALKRDANGRAGQVMESLVDVTALREAQRTLRTLNQELEQRVQQEVAAREAAQTRAAHADRIQALGQLAGGIAHDFNNVLQAVAGGAALISRRPNDAEAVTRLAQLIRDASARGASITQRMLVLARRTDLHAEPVEVEPLLDELREVFVHTLGVGIDISVDTEPKLPRLMADRAQLQTALVNLATNARDAMPQGGILRLAGAWEVIDSQGDAGEDSRAQPHGLRAGLFVRLSVGDNGTGMTKATLARVGEPFFTTKQLGKGTGLGLSMVKGFADESGGAFALDSVEGCGTTATLWLPAVTDPAGGDADEGAFHGYARLTGRILVVDDDQLVRDTLAEQLRELGHKVLAASGGTDAMAILRAHEAIDLMITDLLMPGMDGLALIRQARGLRPSLPAILLTGNAMEATEMDSAPPEQAYTLIRKPTTTEHLNARVTDLLERL